MTDAEHLNELCLTGQVEGGWRRRHDNRDFGYMTTLVEHGKAVAEHRRYEDLIDPVFGTSAASNSESESESMAGKQR